MVDEEAIAEAVVCRPDGDAHLDAISEFAETGFDRVYVHQVGPSRKASCASTSARSSRISKGFLAPPRGKPVAA
jgi:hypothetical protein